MSVPDFLLKSDLVLVYKYKPSFSIMHNEILTGISQHCHEIFTEHLEPSSVVGNQQLLSDSGLLLRHNTGEVMLILA